MEGYQKVCGLVLVGLMLWGKAILPAEAVSEKANIKAKQNELRREEKREEIASKSAEVKGAIEEKRQENRARVAEVHAGRLEKRFSYYNNRLARLIEKLESRFAKLEAEGVVLTEARAKLAEAEAALVDAREKAAEAVTAFRDIEPGDYPHQKELAKEAVEITKSARELFGSALNLLKEAVKLGLEAKK